MEKYRASRNQLQFASDFDDADLNCASLQKPETTENYVDSTIANMLADVDRGFRDAELDLRSTVDAHPFYVLFEPALGCDARTDHTTPKSVWPIFMADVSQILAALQSSITSAVEPRVRELVRSREEILADSFLQQNSGVARREQELLEAREETGALRAATDDLRTQKDEMQDALVREITLLREQLFQKRRIGGTYKPDFAPGSGTEATSLSLQSGKALLYTQQEVDALIRDYAQQQVEERKRFEAKLRAELSGSQEQVSKLASQLEAARESLISTQHELDALRVRYQEDMEGCKAGYEEQVADLVQQISSLQAAASLASRGHDEEIAGRDQTIEKLQGDLLEAQEREAALQAERERAAREAEEALQAQRRAHEAELEALRQELQTRHSEELAASAGEAAARLQRELDAAQEALRSEREENEQLRRRLAAAAKEMSDTVEQLRLQHESDMSDLRSSMNSFSVMSEFAQDVENAERELRDVLKCVDLIFGRIFDEQKGTLTRMLITKDFGAGPHAPAGPGAPGNPPALYAAPEASTASASSASASMNSAANDAASTLGDSVLEAGPGGSIPTSPLRPAPAPAPPSAPSRPATSKSKKIPRNYLYSSVERAINAARLGKVANKYLVKPLRRLLQWSKLYSNEHLCALFGVDYSQWERAVSSLLGGSAVGSAMDALRGLADAGASGGAPGGQPGGPGAVGDLGFDYSDGDDPAAGPGGGSGLGTTLPPSGRARPTRSAGPRGDGRAGSAPSSAGGAPPRPASSTGVPYNAVNSVVLRQDRLVSRPGDAGAPGSGSAGFQTDGEPEMVSRGTSARGAAEAGGADGVGGSAGADGGLGTLSGLYAGPGAGPDAPPPGPSGCEVGVNTEISTSLADSMYRLAGGDAVVVDQARVFECQDCIDIRRSLSAGSRASSTSGSRPGTGRRPRGALTAEEREAGIYEDTDGTPGTPGAGEEELRGGRPLRALTSRPDSGGPGSGAAGQEPGEGPEPGRPGAGDALGLPASPQRVTSAPPGGRGIRCPGCGREISLQELAAWYPVHRGFPTFFYDSDAAEVPVLTRDNLGLPPGWPAGPGGEQGGASGREGRPGADSALWPETWPGPGERSGANAAARFISYTQRLPDGRERVLEEPVLEGVFARILQRAEEMKLRFSRKRELILQERRRTTERILRALSLLNEDRIRSSRGSPRLFSAAPGRPPPPAPGWPSSPSAGASSEGPRSPWAGAPPPGSPGPQPAPRRQRSRILYFEGRRESPSLAQALFRPPSGRRTPGSDSGDARPVAVPVRDYEAPRTPEGHGPGAGPDARFDTRPEARAEPFSVVAARQAGPGPLYHLGPGRMPSAEALARYRDALVGGDAQGGFEQGLLAARSQRLAGPGAPGLARRRPESAGQRAGAREAAGCPSPAGARPLSGGAPPEAFYEFPRAAEARPLSGRARPSSGRSARTPSRPGSGRPESVRPAAPPRGVQAASDGTPVRYAVQALPSSAPRPAGSARAWAAGPAAGRQQDVLELLAQAGVVQKGAGP